MNQYYFIFQHQSQPQSQSDSNDSNLVTQTEKCNVKVIGDLASDTYEVESPRYEVELKSNLEFENQYEVNYNSICTKVKKNLSNFFES